MVKRLQILGERLRALREKRNLTQRQLGELLHIEQSTLARYETGENDPKPAVLKTLVEFFDTSADYLHGLTDDPRSVKAIVAEMIKEFPEYEQLINRLRQGGSELRIQFETLAQLSAEDLRTIVRVAHGFLQEQTQSLPKKDGEA